MKNYKFLIIGANSYIGKKLHNQLSLSFNSNNIFSLGRINSNHYNNFIKCGITDKFEVNNKLVDLEFDIVIYLSSNTIPSRDIEDYENAYDINVEGLKNILKTLKINKLKQFIYFSTSEVYGSKVFEANENDLVSPISVYSLTKVMAENILTFYQNVYNLPLTIIRPSLVYGKNQSERFFIPQAINKLRGNETFNMTYGEQTRDFIHVYDLCDAVIEIIKQKKFINDIVNISSNYEIKIKDLVIYLKELLNSKSKINLGAIAYRGNEIMRYKIDNNKINDILSWFPKKEFKKSLLEIIEDKK